MSFSDIEVLINHAPKDSPVEDVFTVLDEVIPLPEPTVDPIIPDEEQFLRQTLGIAHASEDKNPIHLRRLLEGANN